MVAFKISQPAPYAPPSVKPARSPRRRVLLSGTFHSLTSSCPVKVRNLSCTGASIDCEGTLKIDAEGVLEAEHLDCLCRVIWRKGTLYGLKFDEPLHNNVVLELHRITASDVQRAEATATREWFDRAAR